jgi:hypothetical protein
MPDPNCTHVQILAHSFARLECRENFRDSASITVDSVNRAAGKHFNYHLRKKLGLALQTVLNFGR